MSRPHSTRQAGRSILVIGSPRSGSTWVGKMLSAGPDTAYVHEPYSLSARQAPCYPRFTTWYTYINKENEAEYRERIERLVELRYPWWIELQERPTPRRLVGVTRRAWAYRQQRLRGARPLIKDPIALVSAEWMAETFDTQVVSLIRHPCAFVDSVRRKNWRFDFKNLTSQPALMRELLAPMADEIEDLANHEHDLITNGAVHWKFVHHVILTLRERHPDWIYVRHEDLASDPMPQFTALYGQLGLTVDDRVRATIQEHCYAAETMPDDGRVHRLVRDSRKDVGGWRTRLTPEEVQRVGELVGDVGEAFYEEPSQPAGAAVRS